ncbi:MAG: hypothetical protein AAGG07_11050 [Planctomycetota bacterium]
MQYVKTSVAALTLAAVSQTALAAVTQFADSSFDNPGWSFESHTREVNGSEGGAVLFSNSWRPASGDYLRMRWFSPVETVIYSMAFLADTEWNPAIDGGIGAVDVGMLAANLNPPANTTNGRFYIKQGGRYYQHSFGYSIGSEQVYYTDGLKATDFIELDLVNDQILNDSHPDFTGDESLVFGFGQGWLFTEGGSVGQNWNSGIDNFFLRIHHRPVPAPGALVALGLGAAVRRRR